jgi:predicted glutamine amidotransferase
MCQLLGMSCNSTAAITFSFTGFAQRGGRTADHTDGWGIAFYERSGCRVFHDDLPACDSPLARFVGEYSIKSKFVLAHIRKATQGLPTLSNCHPFQREWLGQPWIFATNGDLRNFHPALSGPYLPIGTTDSERAFCWLLQELSRSFADRLRPVAWAELAPRIAELTEFIARHGNFNFLLSNGDAMFAHCSSKLYALSRTHPFPTAHLVDCDVSLNLSEFNRIGDRMTVIATEPLTSEEPWAAFVTGESRVFVDGEQVWQHVNPNTRAFPVAVPDDLLPSVPASSVRMLVAQ